MEDPKQLIENLAILRQSYEKLRFEIAKKAFNEMNDFVKKWESHEVVNVAFFWDHVVRIDGENYHDFDFEEKEEETQ